MICPNNNEVTFDQIYNLKMKKPPGVSSRWKGIRHITFLNMLLDEMKKQGLTVVAKRFALSKDKYDLTGSFDVRVFGHIPPKDHIFSLGIITSNGRHVRNRIAVGTTIRETESGFVTGLITLGKRTQNYEPETAIEEAVSTYKERINKIQTAIANLEDTELTEKQVDRIIMRASRCTPHRARPAWEKLGVTLKDYNAGEDKTAWGLMLAFSVVAKKSIVFRQIPQLIRFRQILTSATKVKV